jgi:protein TonB
MYMIDLERKNKLPAIATAVAVHVVMIGLALQSSGYVSIPAPRIIDLLPPNFIEKPDEQPKPIKQTELPPMKPIILESPLQPSEDTTIKSTTVFKEGDPLILFKKVEVVYVGEPVIKQHNPIYTQASVDANACEKPTYPSSSIRLQEEGTVTLAMQIGIDGRVLDARVEKSSGYKTLDKAAIAGLSLCSFKPANTDGTPENSWTKLQYAWKID